MPIFALANVELFRDYNGLWRSFVDFDIIGESMEEEILNFLLNKRLSDSTQSGFIVVTKYI